MVIKEIARDFVLTFAGFIFAELHFLKLEVEFFPFVVIGGFLCLEERLDYRRLVVNEERFPLQFKRILIYS